MKSYSVGVGKKKMTKSERKKARRKGSGYKGPLATFGNKNDKRARKHGPRRPTTPSSNLYGTEYTVPWENVTFEYRYLIIKKVVPRKTMAILFEQARESFNFIKKRIKDRLPPLKIHVRDNQAKIIDKVFIEDVLHYMDCKHELADMVLKNLPDFKRYYEHIPTKLNGLFFPPDKKEYLDILCNLQSDNYKIIPVAEAIGSSIEDSFIFTIDKGATIYIIWENTNLNRATYIFISPREKYEENIQLVFDYIVGIIRAKRERLRKDRSMSKILTEYETINHTDVPIWNERINLIMRD